MAKVFNISTYFDSSDLQLESIEIISPPDKLEYYSGENFDPTGMVVTAVYNGNTTAVVTGYGYTPVTLHYGDEKVIVSYTNGLITKSASIDVTVNRIQVDIPQQTGTLTYNGEVQIPTWINYDSSIMMIDGTTSAENAGTYSAQFHLDQDHEWSDGSILPKTVNWTIQKATIAYIPSQNGSLTYDGTSQTPSWNNYSSLQLTIGGDVFKTNAGDYTASFTPTDNYQWADGTIAAKTVAWAIQKAPISQAPSQSGSLSYTGEAQSPTWNNYSSSQLTIGGSTSETNAGTYYATFTPTSNYKWGDGSTSAKSVSWSIAKIPSTIEISKSSISAQANWQTERLRIDTTGDGECSVTSSNSSVATGSVNGHFLDIQCLGVGTAIVTVTISEGTNYLSASASVTVELERTKLAVPSTSDTFVYNGSSQSPTWTGYPDAKKTASGTLSATNAGTYSVTFSLSNTSAYQWSDGTDTPKTVTWSIAKADRVITLSPASLTLTSNAGEINKVSTINCPGIGDGTLTATSNNVNVSTAIITNMDLGDVSYKVVSVTGVKTGSTTVAVSISAGTNYKAASAQLAVTMTKYVEQLRTELITESKTWTNTTGRDMDVTVMCFGGGGGGGVLDISTDDPRFARAGAGGGRLASGVVNVKANESVNITIGPAGQNTGNGGTTSFGTYLSAYGGSSAVNSRGSYTPMSTNGGSGGTGGGAGYITFDEYINATNLNPVSAYGGDGQYGGGGGGGTVVCDITSYTYEYEKFRGGAGGIYGGGGGGGGVGIKLRNNLDEANASDILHTRPGPGGGITSSSTTHGGKGGTPSYTFPGTASPYGLAMGITPGTRPDSGTDTSAMNLPFTGSGAAGANRNFASPYNEGDRITNDSGIMPKGVYFASGGGGGGGGYGGEGGWAGAGLCSNGNAYPGGGGGGGGYGAKGGGGGYPTDSYPFIGGGGGGGYGGNGGDALSNGFDARPGVGYGAGACGSVGGGGGGYGKTTLATRENGAPGICVLTYYERLIDIT